MFDEIYLFRVFVDLDKEHIRKLRNIILDTRKNWKNSNETVLYLPLCFLCGLSFSGKTECLLLRRSFDTLVGKEMGD